MDNKIASSYYSEDSFWKKIKQFAKIAGVQVVYRALLLYYVLQKPDVPMWVKTVIVGALGYFIMPIDTIPDMVPMAGFTDDLGALAAALAIVALYIDDDVKKKAKEKLRSWFGNVDDDELEIF